MAQTNVTYIEASTANRWRVGEFPQRVGRPAYEVTLLREYDFDKTAKLAQALAAAKRPDVIVLQECAVYFPGPFAQYQQQFRGWVEQVRAAGVQPVVATVVPPARSQGWFEDAKAFIKVRLLGREAQAQQVWRFNDWLRELAAQERIALLDLEQLLRVSATDRHLRPEFDSGDGIHVNDAAHERMDRLLLETLERRGAVARTAKE